MYSPCNCTTDPPLYTPQPNCHHCPSPPPIQPCGCDDQGNPIWYDKHPLIPMANGLTCGIPHCLDEDQLICYMKIAETLYSTCRLPGYSYYQAIIFHALAMGEYMRDLEIYKESTMMGISLGEKSNMERPTLYNSGVFGEQLRLLLDSIPKMSYVMGC